MPKKSVLENIVEIAKKISIDKENLELYGDHIAKIINIRGKRKAKLILVTSISPTPSGEGKTTISIGLNDSLRRLNKNSVVVLREPSMGPVFGIKGGANGGGKAQVLPKDKVNLHFTGDIHAITTANNLIAANIDNHIY
jgi:formate--tetrahydrofolate ligase